MVVFFVFAIIRFDEEAKKNMVKVICLRWILIKWSRVENKIHRSNTDCWTLIFSRKNLYSFEEICRILAPIAIRRSVTFRWRKKNDRFFSFHFVVFFSSGVRFPCDCHLVLLKRSTLYIDMVMVPISRNGLYSAICFHIQIFYETKWEDRFTITVRAYAFMLEPQAM